MLIKFKRLSENAVIPKRAKHGDAGFDLVATEVVFHKSNRTIDRVVQEYNKLVEYRTGIAVEIPDGNVGLLFPRGSVLKYDLSLTNSVGVIDSGYRGELRFVFRIHENEKVYVVGDRVGQIVFIELPSVELQEAAILTDSERGEGRWGSSGR